MRKINNISTYILGGLLAVLYAAGAYAQLPGSISVQQLPNGATNYLTDTGTWQADEWSGGTETNIARDLAGNIYMAGTFSDGDSNLRPFLRKVSPAGAEIWTSTITNSYNPTSGYDYGRGVAVGLDGSIYSLSVVVRDTQDILVTKHDPATGAPIWQTVYDSGDYSDNAFDIVADASFAYVAGTKQQDIAIFRFPAAGGPATVTAFDGGNYFNTAYSIAQNTDNLALAGSVY